MDSKVMFNLTYGLFVLSVHCGKRDNACIINTAVQVASNPDRLSISVNKANLTCDILGYTDDFTLSVISEDADFELFKCFGFRSGRDCEKFDGFDDCKRLSNGTLAVTRGTNSYISAHITDRIDLGSHVMFIAEITDGEVLSNVPSASYAYYHSTIKPKPEEKKTADGKTVWRCEICGYEYEGETLPEDFVCPICKHGASDFVKVE